MTPEQIAEAMRAEARARYGQEAAAEAEWVIEMTAEAIALVVSEPINPIVEPADSVRQRGGE